MTSTEHSRAVVPPSPALELEHLSVAYGPLLALESVTMQVPTGAVMGIVGPNGAGKSTLLKAALGLIPVLSGSIRFFSGSRGRHRQQIGYVPQSTSVDWDFPATARDVVLMGTYGRLGWLRRPGPTARQFAATAMEQVGISDLAGRQIGELSGGQRQRVFLARALAQQADLYLMDEPFQGVDARSQQAILAVLHQIRDAGGTVVLVHHDLATVRAYCDHVALVNRSLVAAGPARETLTAEAVAQAYGVPGGEATILGGGP